jgi:DNA polymerase I-like protein with 3'-5' exonuclease and polymerase domains
MNTTSFDIETTGLDPFKDKIVSMQVFSPVNNSPIYQDINGLMWKEQQHFIGKYLVDPGDKIIMHNAKFEWEWMYVKYGVEITNFEDTMLLSFILDRGVPFQYKH